MSKDYSDALKDSVEPLQAVDRAKEITHHIVTEYKFFKNRLKADQTINLFCTVGRERYDVHSISVEDGMVYIETATKDSYSRITCPFDQISFAIIISVKTSEDPPREITGFKPIEEAHKNA
jgi:hypothetical protein